MRSGDGDVEFTVKDAQEKLGAPSLWRASLGGFRLVRGRAFGDVSSRALSARGGARLKRIPLRR